MSQDNKYTEMDGINTELMWPSVFTQLKDITSLLKIAYRDEPDFARQLEKCTSELLQKLPLQRQTNLRHKALLQAGIQTEELSTQETETLKQQLLFENKTPQEQFDYVCLYVYEPAEKLKWALESAKNGCSDAQAFVGWCYDYGIGTDENDMKCMFWYTKAAKQNNIEATHSLKQCIEYHKIPRDEKEANQIFSSALKEYLEFAKLYGFQSKYDSKQLNQDQSETVDNKIIEELLMFEFTLLNDATINEKLGDLEQLLYRHISRGHVTIVDSKQGEMWLKKSLKRGNIKAYASKSLNFIHKKIYNNVVVNELCKQAALQGHNVAQEIYASILEKNGDYKQSMEWQLQSANHGNIYSSFKIGHNYYYGFGEIKANEQKALEWFTKSAEKGTVRACFYLGIIHFKKDKYLGAYWYAKGAEQGEARCQVNLAACYEAGHGVDIDKKKTLFWNMRGANRGNESGQHNLGMHFLYGVGIEKDEVSGVKWLTLSAEQGCIHSPKKLVEYYTNKKDIVNANKWAVKIAEQTPTK